MNSYKAIEDRYLKVGSINTRYWSAGERGTPVILLHGGGSSIEVWTHNINALAHKHRVFAFDMVGTGFSDKPMAEYSLDFQVQFLHEFLNTIEVDRVVLIGNSMGGSISLKFALLSPERVEKLVLVSSFGLGREIYFGDRLLAVFPEIVKLARPSRWGAKLILSSCVYNSKLIPEILIEQDSRRFGLPGQKAAIVSLIKHNIDFWGIRRDVFRSIVDHLQDINAPTFVIWGKQDKIIPVSLGNVATNKIPNVRAHVFDHCGHWAQFEHPQEFNRLVLDFLSS
jgi:pimeloyl-ACP methyl ester carboxylesterase